MEACGSDYERRRQQKRLEFLEKCNKQGDGKTYVNMMETGNIGDDEDGSQDPVLIRANNVKLNK